MRTILISGASRGIGRAIAERMLADGHRLSLGLRDPKCLIGSSLDPAIAGSEQVFLHPYEAQDVNAAKSWVSASLAHFNGFDSLIHCAGIFHRTPIRFNDNQQHEIDQLWQVNVMGPWMLSRAAWSQLECHAEARIIVLVSMSGKRSKGRLAGYTVSKFALMGLCQTMRNEGWEQGIRVTAICPGWVNTDMAARVKSLPKEAMTQPDDIASLSSNLLQLPNSCVPFELSMNCTHEI